MKIINVSFSCLHLVEQDAGRGIEKIPKINRNFEYDFFLFLFSICTTTIRCMVIKILNNTPF